MSLTVERVEATSTTPGNMALQMEKQNGLSRDAEGLIVSIVRFPPEMLYKIAYKSIRTSFS